MVWRVKWFQGIADRYWTEHTGVRAADDGMTTFWDEQASTGDDELFNDLPAPTEEPSASADEPAANP